MCRTDLSLDCNIAYFHRVCFLLESWWDKSLKDKNSKESNGSLKLEPFISFFRAGFNFPILKKPLG